LKILCAAIILFSAAAILYGLIKSKKRIRKAAVNGIQGLLALLLVHITSLFTAVSAPISLLSIGTAVVLGIPGVILQLILNVIW